MVELWGYKIPWTPTQRGFRAAYRDAARHSTLQDISSYVCIELRGNQAKLIETLSPLCPKDVGSSFAFKPSLRGLYEGHTILYDPDLFPYGVIGPISFLWRPNELQMKENSEFAQIWIWAHPSFWLSVLNLLVKQLNVTKINETLYKNQENEFELELLKDNLNRFRLVGPAATSITVENQK